MVTHNVIVVGGGAGGMMAAIFAARTGANVTLLERNQKLGRKVYITGKGRCNVTNDCTIDEFMREVPRNPRFLYSALSYFTPQQMMELLEDEGCPVVVQRGRRVFPATEKASDVTRALEKTMRALGVRIVFDARVKDIVLADGAVSGVTMMDGTEYAADRVIIATGGLSCPLTGSSGDGYRMAERLGHTVTPRMGVLSAIETAVQWPGELQGLSLRNVTLTMKKGKKTLYSELGEMIFTHFGISGPLALTMSCHLPDDIKDAQVTLNLKPGLTEQQLDARMQRDFAEQSRRQLRNVLPGLLPARLAEIFPRLCGVDGDKVCAQITREERETLVKTMQALPIPLEKLAPIEEAIVTRGGVHVKEIDPATMESKLVPGLYFAGEVIDVDAHTGGYNLQIAWATGALAGTCAAEAPIG
ncbi:MAG: NAD(P)/FAD-dependent oxidoreductase [Clostridia bacterium]|nr:NAD(P)/FAD-dependent oxidoreductase [Clostridia bacterium]